MPRTNTLPFWHPKQRKIAQQNFRRKRLVRLGLTGGMTKAELRTLAETYKAMRPNAERE